jgi:hypothetical protein
MNTGYHPWKGIETTVESCNEATKDFAEKMKKIHDKSMTQQLCWRKPKKTMKEYYDMCR